MFIRNNLCSTLFIIPNEDLLSFETGPCIGHGYNFKRGGFIKILYHTNNELLLEGIFEDASILDGRLIVNLINCKVPEYLNTYELLPVGFERKGIMNIGF